MYQDTERPSKQRKIAEEPQPNSKAKRSVVNSKGEREDREEKKLLEGLEEELFSEVLDGVKLGAGAPSNTLVESQDKAFIEVQRRFNQLRAITVTIAKMPQHWERDLVGDECETQHYSIPMLMDQD